MQINRTTDYALRILICLGKENRTVPSSEIAKSMRISQRYLLSIARGLKDQGYINVGFGPDGGYSVARPLNLISLYNAKSEFNKAVITIDYLYTAINATKVMEDTLCFYTLMILIYTMKR